MSVEVIKKINELSNIADKDGLSYDFPTDDMIMMYQNETGISFNEETKIYFKNLPYLSYNGLDPVLLTGNSENWPDLLNVIHDARKMGVPDNWLPIMEANGDYYCVKPDGKVAFWSHDGSTDEEWEDIAAWIHKVWIGGN